MTRVLKYVQPANEAGDPVFVFVSEKVAVEQQKKAAVLHGYVYERDEDAVLDFMAVHWAWDCEAR